MSAEPAAIPARPVALVTGASSGIGRAFAEHFLRSGHDVFAVGRDAEALDSLAAGAPPGGATVTTCVSDLSTASGVSRVLELCPGPDVVVANAGYTIAGRAGTADWRALEDLSYLTGAGVAQLLEALAPGMVRRGTGDVLIVSSIASLIRMPGSAVYAARSPTPRRTAAASIASCAGRVCGCVSSAPGTSGRRCTRDRVSATWCGRCRAGCGWNRMLSSRRESADFAAARRSSCPVSSTGWRSRSSTSG